MHRHQHQQSDRVEMLERVERETSGVFRRRIAQPVRHEAVTQLVQREADERGDDAQQDLKKRGKI